jgi:predicted lipoprotein with Yx(FWY)xxD motif
MRGWLAATVAALAVGGAAASAAVPVTPGDVSLVREGKTYLYRADDGLPLYTFDKDAPGRSSCTGPCATVWPPLAASPGSRPLGEWTLLKRSDGKLQWAWRGRPVYTHAGDEVGKTAGDGVGGAWRLIPPVAVN